MTRSGLRGFAFGILIACAVIAYYYFQVAPQQKEKTAKAAPLTEENVTAYLDNHKMVAISQSKFDEWHKDAQKAADANSKNTSSKDKSKTDQAKVYSTVLNIQSGMTTKNIADKLLADHIIKDKTPFYHYMDTNKLEKYVQLGKYKITSKMSIPEIAKTITKGHS